MHRIVCTVFLWEKYNTRFFLPQLTVHGDRVQLDVINPKREKSGIYKVIMKNAQGQDERDIHVNIMDVPTPPQQVRVTDVYQDNCVVHWSPPKDNGGTDIKKYIVEVNKNLKFFKAVSVALLFLLLCST